MGFNGPGGIENRMAARIDSGANFETNPIVRAAHEKTLKLFNGDAINPTDFKDIYDPAVIDRDLKKVAHLKEDVFEVRSDKIAADILEGIIYEQSELAEWFGPHAHTIKTSEYDDIVNGVDLVLEMSEPRRSSSHLALGVDATYGTQTVEKKFARIKRDIDGDRLATIKYFQSSDGRFKGMLRQVPRIVLGVERGTVLTLARQWTENKKTELGSHPVQDMLLQQARRQLLVFGQYAQAQHRHESARSYMQAYAALKGITDAKQPQAITEQYEHLAGDKVNAQIVAGLRDFQPGK